MTLSVVEEILVIPFNDDGESVGDLLIHVSGQSASYKSLEDFFGANHENQGKAFLIILKDKEGREFYLMKNPNGTLSMML